MTGVGRPDRTLPFGYGRDEGTVARPVWVVLPVAYPAVPQSSEEVGDQRIDRGAHGRGVLVLEGEVRGELHGWERAADGQWLGVVSYAVPLRDDVRPAKKILLGLVPAAALRPRDPHDV